MKGLRVDVRVSESLVITVGGEQIRVTVEEKSGRLARLRVDAPASVVVTPPSKK